MLPNLDKIEQKYRETEQELMNPDVVKDIKRFQRLSKEHTRLKQTFELVTEYKRVCRDMEEHRALINSKEDDELKNLAKAELPELTKSEADLAAKIQVLLVPRDENDEKGVIVEIRAGTGGDEAAIFGGDLYRMYTRYAETKGWKSDVMNSAPSERGGFKEIIFSVEGNGVYGELRFENGVHRVQRVPETETQGRVHTSAASVVVMPEAEDVDIQIKESDLRIDVFRSSGPGGQNVNKTESAVRITHIPTGVVVSCQDEKSQHKNKAKALKVLKTRILDAEQERKEKADSVTRKAIVGSGDRSAKIRTYNFPQNRLTDHRINLTLYALDRIMEGQAGEVFESLRKADVSEKMEAMAEAGGV